MLVLSRREGEWIRIGDSITITIVRTGGDKVRVGIDAPNDLLILRGELEVYNNERHISTDNTIDSTVISPSVSKPAA
ncbi:MAG: carbon storage regulator [Planctomycetaceae bacterium]|jgi:carbon storage regulator|nr:carbon storage regulator [Planctomycetaceae bacterium]